MKRDVYILNIITTRIRSSFTLRWTLNNASATGSRSLTNLLWSHSVPISVQPFSSTCLSLCAATWLQFLIDSLNHSSKTTFYSAPDWIFGNPAQHCPHSFLAVLQDLGSVLMIPGSVQKDASHDGYVCICVCSSCLGENSPPRTSPDRSKDQPAASARQQILLQQIRIKSSHHFEDTQLI